MKKSIKEIPWVGESISAVDSFNTANQENIIEAATTFCVFSRGRADFHFPRQFLVIFCRGHGD